MQLRSTSWGCLAIILLVGQGACTYSGSEKHSTVQNSQATAPATADASRAASQKTPPPLTDEQLSALALAQLDKQLDTDDEVLPAVISSSDYCHNLMSMMLPLFKKWEAGQLQGLWVEALKFVDTNGDNQIDQDEMNAAIAKITAKAKGMHKELHADKDAQRQKFCAKIASKMPTDITETMNLGTTIYASIAAMHCLAPDDNASPHGGFAPAIPFDFNDFCQNMPATITAVEVDDQGQSTGDAETSQANESKAERSSAGAAATKQGSAASLHAPGLPINPQGPLHAWLKHICVHFTSTGAPHALTPAPATTESKGCCEAATLECLACSAGLSPQDYCAQNAKQVGCEQLTK